jgi:hypothetical protein
MRSVAVSGAFAFTLSMGVVAPVFAADPPSPTLPSLPPPSSAAPPAAVAPVAPPPVAVMGVCVVGAHPTIDPAQARALVGALCDDLRRYGVPVSGVSDAPPPGAPIHRVDLEPIGRLVMVRLTHEQPAGTVRATRRALASSLEEVVRWGAPLAYATAKDLPFDDTSRAASQPPPSANPVQTYVPPPVTPVKEKDTVFHFGVGGLAYALPAAGAYSGYGMEVAFAWEGRRASFVIDLGAAGLGSDHDGLLASAGLGGRYYPVDGDVTPVLGGGLALGTISWRDGKNDATKFSGSGSGAGAFALAGVRIARSSSVGVELGLRVDLPFYSLQSSSLVYQAGPPVATGGPPGVGSYVPDGATRYVVPLTLNATFFFR